MSEPMYHVEFKEGTGMSMSDARFRDTVYARVVAQDGKLAWESEHRFKDGNRAASIVKMQAGKKCKAYESYFARTGNRWEVEQAEKRELAKKEHRFTALQKNIMTMYHELELLAEGLGKPMPLEVTQLTKGK